MNERREQLWRDASEANERALRTAAQTISRLRVTVGLLVCAILFLTIALLLALGMAW